MKKIVKISLILVITILSMITYVSAVSNCKISMQTLKNEFSKQEEFTVDVVLTNIQDERGIIILNGTLEYDKNSLTLVKIEAENGWSSLSYPSYNEQNGKFAIDRNGFATSDEIVFKMTFKVKEQSTQKVEIALKDMVASNATQDIELGNVVHTITIKNEDETPDTTPEQAPNETPDTKPEQTPNEIPNTNQEQNSNQTSSTNDTTIKNETLPQTGYNNIILIVLIVLLVFVLIFYIKIRIVNKKINSLENKK